MHQDEGPAPAEKGLGMFLFLGTLPFLLLLVGVSYFLSERLDDIEDRLKYVPPPSYQPPDLEQLEAVDLAVGQLPVRQTVYVPVYSHIYYQGGSPFLLEATLSIRNVDRDQSVYVKSVEYFDTAGKLVQSHLDRTIMLAPLQTIEFLVEQPDSMGGSGANFLVEWMTAENVDKPLVETVMVGTAGTQGVCFSRTGIEISSPIDSSGVE